MKNTFVILLGILLLGGAGLLLTSLPVGQDVTSIPFTLEDGMSGVLEVRAPRYLRLGDEDVLELKVTLTPAETVDASVKIKASLVGAGLESDPATAVTAVIAADGTASFHWRIKATASGEQQITLWCLREGADGLTLILAREMKWEVKTFLQLRFQLARWIFIELMIMSTLLAGFTWLRRRRN